MSSYRRGRDYRDDDYYGPEYKRRSRGPEPPRGKDGYGSNYRDDRDYPRSRGSKGGYYDARGDDYGRGGRDKGDRDRPRAYSSYREGKGGRSAYDPPAGSRNTHGENFDPRYPQGLVNSLRLLIPDQYVQRVIGERGDVVRRIGQECHVFIKISSQPFKTNDHCTDRVVSICPMDADGKKGDSKWKNAIEQCTRALCRVMQEAFPHVEKEKDGVHKCVVLAPANCAGLIIGPKGSRVAQVKNNHDVDIQLTKPPHGQYDEEVLFKGSLKNIEAVLNQLNDVLKVYWANIDREDQRASQVLQANKLIKENAKGGDLIPGAKTYELEEKEEQSKVSAAPVSKRTSKAAGDADLESSQEQSQGGDREKEGDEAGVDADKASQRGSKEVVEEEDFGDDREDSKSEKSSAHDEESDVAPVHHENNPFRDDDAEVSQRKSTKRIASKRIADPGNDETRKPRSWPSEPGLDKMWSTCPDIPVERQRQRAFQLALPKGITKQDILGKDGWLVREIRAECEETGLGRLNQIVVMESNEEVQVHCTDGVLPYVVGRVSRQFRIVEARYLEKFLGRKNASYKELHRRAPKDSEVEMFALVAKELPREENRVLVHRNTLDRDEPAKSAKVWVDRTTGEITEPQPGDADYHLPKYHANREARKRKTSAPRNMAGAAKPKIAARQPSRSVEEEDAGVADFPAAD
ncbi:unnamed protein product [Amoebophrya sp. A120]|nr:unnamed protein product [Amoebophrya sp. A120]|eukprot:GSA120T00011390001.1